MGCDIHFYVETRQEDGSWKTADTWELSEYNEPGDPLSVDYKKAFYSGRGYDLFSILADVRNGRGFAGIKTGEGFNPISVPRGVPKDACEQYRAVVERWDCDGHSHSHLTLAELLTYDWTQQTTHQGWVGPSDWAKWRDNGKPEGWSGAVSGGEVEHLDSTEFEQAWQQLRVEKGYPEQRRASVHLSGGRWGGEASEDMPRFLEILGRGKSPHCLVKWTEPYYRSASNFWADTMPRLLALGKPEDVRCCFFFDN